MLNEPLSFNPAAREAGYASPPYDLLRGLGVAEHVGERDEEARVLGVNHMRSEDYGLLVIVGDARGRDRCARDRSAGADQVVPVLREALRARRARVVEVAGVRVGAHDERYGLDVSDGNVALADGCGAMLEEALEEAAADEVPLALEQGAGDVRVVAVPCDGVAIGENGLKTVGAVG